MKWTAADSSVAGGWVAMVRGLARWWVRVFGDCWLVLVLLLLYVVFHLVVASRAVAEGSITDTLELISDNVELIGAGVYAAVAELHRVAVINLLAVGLLVTLVILTVFDE